MKNLHTLLSLSIGLLAVATCDVGAQEDQELAKQLSNPIASLVSLPFQFNYDANIGPARNGEKFTLNIQPVIPISLGDDWNVISRTIVPVVYQQNIFPGSGEQSGLGDTTQSFFFSPKDAGPSGIIWGAGPVFLLPTGTDDLLSGRKWGIGPTAVVLKQFDGWTVGALGNHIWSVAGDDSRSDVNATFLQPFVSYTTASAWTYSLNTESTYNWEIKDWSIPINLGVSKVVKFGTQPVSLGATARYWADSSESGPHGWAVRVNATFLFPVK